MVNAVGGWGSGRLVPSGEAVQVEPMKPLLKAPGSMLLKLS